MKNLPLWSLMATSLLIQPVSACPEILNHSFRTLKGKSENLCAYQGKVVLVVNTASFCGYTPQYQGLQALYQKYQKQGLVVLGFPANDFGRQEPGSDREIASFCQKNYQVSFPMYSKSVVRGQSTNPLFIQLQQKTGEAPLWNFHKYLIDRTGQKVLSFSSSVSPEDPDLLRNLQTMLKQK